MVRIRHISRTGLRRSLVALFLGLLIIAGNQGLAMVHGVGSAGGEATEMVLCTGTGPVTVWIDANGDPVAPPHDCPDCTLCLPHGLLPETAQPARAMRVARSVLRPAPPKLVSRPAPGPVARGPPFRF